VGWEWSHGFGQSIAQIISSAVTGQVHEDDEACGPFDQSGDGGPATLSND
jgi:hypothetical protein